MKSQRKQVLEHLLKGKTLTQNQSQTKFGCQRLASVINRKYKLIK